MFSHMTPLLGSVNATLGGVEARGAAETWPTRRINPDYSEIWPYLASCFKSHTKPDYGTGKHHLPNTGLSKSRLICEGATQHASALSVVSCRETLTISFVANTVPVQERTDSLNIWYDRGRSHGTGKKYQSTASPYTIDSLRPTALHICATSMPRYMPSRSTKWAFQATKVELAANPC